MQAGKNITAKRIHTTQSEKYKYPCFGGNGLRGYVTNYNTEGTFSLVGRQGALCGNVNIVSGKFYATEHAVVTDGYGLTDTIWMYFFLQALNLNQYATATAQPGWKSHTNLTHPGKYFRPSKVKIMRPTSPK